MRRIPTQAWSRISVFFACLVVCVVVLAMCLGFVLVAWSLLHEAIV